MNPSTSFRRTKAPKTSSQPFHSAIGRKHRPDYGLLVAMMLLVAIGLVVIYSVSPAISAQLKGSVDSNHFMYRQLTFLLLGFGVFFATSLLPLKWWVHIQKYLIIAAVLSFLLLFIPAFSITHLGATRWIHIGPINYQPAEILKFALVFSFAMFFAHRMREDRINEGSTTRVFLGVMALVGLEIVIIQRDLGTMIPIVAIMLTMLYVAGINKLSFVKITALIIVAAALAILPFQHRRERVFTFLNSSADVEDSGYHINQALIAVGSGGVFGKGLGRSVQAYGYLPEAANDSIFAVMAEKFGFIGVLCVFAVYGALLMRILYVSQRAPNHYLQLICVGVFAWMAIQAFVNVGAMLGIMPLTGVTLPFLSFGGTSLVFSMAALGVVFNISRYINLGRIDEKLTNGGASDENTHGRRGLGRSRYATQSGR